MSVVAPNKSLHQTKPLVTHLACARSAPNSFAGETNDGADALRRAIGPGVCSQSLSARRSAPAIKRLEPAPAKASKLALANAAQTPGPLGIASLKRQEFGA